MGERTFQFRLRSSHPDADAIATMQERMKLCPISRNLPDRVRKRIDLTLLG
ncbi:MAG: hypothetical protein HQ527_00495 [Cyanobacteria bacterium]|nr:hypothetical protein [Cyanobacteria bacterium bin.51]